MGGLWWLSKRQRVGKRSTNAADLDSRQQTPDRRQQRTDRCKEISRTARQVVVVEVTKADGQTAESRQKRADSIEQTAESRQKRADSREQTADEQTEVVTVQKALDAVQVLYYTVVTT
jgi:hypothetical protein